MSLLLLGKESLFMATKTLHEVRSMVGSWELQPGDRCAGCSVGIMAHNKETDRKQGGAKKVLYNYSSLDEYVLKYI